MKPGDLVTCSSCGAQAVAFTTQPERWQPDWPVGLTWGHGPHPRTEVTREPPDECLWCKERHAVLPGAEPLYRPAPGAPPAPPYGQPELARPAAVESSDAIERFEALAAAFQRETGIWPPGKDRPAAMGSDGIDEQERMARWVEWLRARNAAAAAPRPPPKPKKGTQLGLFGGAA